MPLLAQLVVEYIADMTDLVSNSQRAIDVVNQFASSVSSVNTLSTAFTEAGQSANTLANDLNTVKEAESGIQTAVASADTALMEEAEAATNAGNDMTMLAEKTEQAGNAQTSLGEKSNSSKFNLLDFGAQIGQTMFGMQAMAQTAMSLASALIEPDASMEQTKVAFTQLLGSASAADAELKNLQDFAAATPFEFPELANSTQKLLAFQIPLKNTQPLLTAIGDALSGLGKNTAASLDQVVNVFGQMNAAGKIQTQDLMQLTSVGINGFQLLADQMGKPVSVIKEMVTAGTIPATKGIEMLRAGMEKTFGGGMQAQSQTFNGLLSTFQDNIMGAYRAFSGPLFDAAKAGIEGLGNAVSSPAFQDFAKTLGTDIANSFKQLQPLIAQFGTFFMQQWNNLQDVMDSLDIKSLIGAFTSLQDNLKKVDGTSFMVMLNNISNLFMSMIPIIVSFATQGMQFLNTAMIAMAPVFDAVNRGVSQIALALQDALPSIMNLVEAFMKWATTSGFLQATAEALTFAINVVVGVVVFLIDTIKVLADFFTQTSLGAAILQAVFQSTFGGIILIVNLVKAAITAWNVTAAATVAAWGATGAFFQSLWKTIQDTFNGIGSWFHDKFQQASDGVKSGFQSAKDFFGGVGQWFKDQGTTAAQGTQDGLKQITDGYNTMVHNVADSLVWWYNHNYYVQAIVDGIIATVNYAVGYVTNAWQQMVIAIQTNWQMVSVFAQQVWSAISNWVTQTTQTAIADVQQGWTTVVGWLQSIWNSVLAFVTPIWNAISNAVVTAVTTVAGLVITGWTVAVNWLTAQWNLLAGLARTAWAAVSAVFSSIWSTYISGPLGNLWNQIMGWFTSLGTQARTSGTNFINMLVQGIQSGAGSVWNAVVGIANTIWTALGFHSPAKAGPGADADVWMPNLINMLADGLDAGAPRIQTSVNGLASILTGLNTNPSIATGIGALSPAQQQAASGPAGQSQGDTEVNIWLDTDKIVNTVMSKAQKKIDIRQGR